MIVKPVLVKNATPISLGSIVEDPTFGLGHIILCGDEECYYSASLSGGSITTPWKRNLNDRLIHKQLAFISIDPNEKFEEGDLLLDSDLKTSFELYSPYEIGDIAVDEFYKVIALQKHIPENYIQRFIEEYNKGEVKDVELKTSWHKISHGDERQWYKSKPFVKLTNGFVTIINKKVEEPIFYNEKEVKRLCSKAALASFGAVNILEHLN